MKKIIMILVAIALVAGAAIAIKKKKEQIARTPAVASYPLPVEAAEVREGGMDISSHYIGTVAPFVYADMSPRITGQILSMDVREGDRVHKGQILAMIDDRELKERELAQAAAVASAEAELAGVRSVFETQQAIFERDEALSKEGAISMEAFQRSRAQRDSVQAQVRDLENKIAALKNIHKATAVELSYTRLYSPIDGVVAKRLQEPGDLALPGKPIVKVEGVSEFKILINIPETEMPLMKKGGKVALMNGKDRVDTAITRVYPAVGVGTLGTIEIDLQRRPFNIPSGGTVGVDVMTGRIDKASVIPLNALLEDKAGSFVYKIDGRKIEILKVQVLGKDSGYAALSGDLRAGDIVATGDEGKLMRLSDGMEVIPILRHRQVPAR